MNLTIEDNLHGFTVQSAESIPEIDGEAYTLFHEKSGARLLYLKNDDNNKAFSITFKTVPADDTGVFHILEHSVLCGSDKFPVKEPFVNLLKSSMQTFLNAMTFPDKTMYPVASTNDKDLLNLTDVYMDAVLRPLIYRKKEIFEQEGWHFEIAEESPDGSSPQALALNGVVYNEMKGALSDSNSVLYDALQSSLFPDTAYRFESGGLPSAIPDLTYEQYLEEHERHYRLDNSYLTLYGNLDLEAMLSFLDREYLSPLSDEQNKKDQQRLDQELPLLTPHKLHAQDPVVCLGVTKKMETSPESSCIGLGYIAGKVHNRTQCVAIDILLDAIMGSNEAPLKRALLDANLASDAQAFLADSLLQPFAVIQLRDLQPHAAQNFRTTVEKTLRELSEGLLNHDLVEASISRSEFVMRERNFGMADGVALSMAALSGWIYDDNLATSYLHYEDDFAFLRAELERGYFEKLIREVFLENSHMAEVEIIPTTEQDNHELQRLIKVQASFEPADFEEAAQKVRRLREHQETPDPQESLATLPYLSLSDLQEAPASPTFQQVNSLPFTCLKHDISTHGITYVYRYFSLKHLTFEDLPYVALLGLLLGKLDTEHHSAAEIDTLTNGKLGSLTFFPEIHENENDPQAFIPHFVVGASALCENIEHLAKLPLEIMLTTSFTNTDKIKDVLQQCRVGLEHAFSASGHAAAMSRLSSYYLPAGVAREYLSGVEFYRFLKELLESFDDRSQQLIADLADISERLFIDNKSMVSFTGQESDFGLFTQYGIALNKTGETTSRLTTPLPEVKNEAFIIPSDVSYSAQGFDHRSSSVSYSGSWQVAARALSYDYLWNEVRVKGGAYGSGFQTARTGNLRFYSYRDPRIDETYDRFAKAATWLQSFDPSQEEMDGYIVSSVAGFDKPQKARELIRRQDGAWITGKTPADRLKARSEIIGTTPHDIQSLSQVVQEAVQSDARCTFSSKDILEEAQTPFTIIDLFNE